MIEKDNIRDLFSKTLENHTSPVRPEVWNGLQAKMAAAGVSSAAAGVKGISALAKWLIGSAAVSVAAVTTVVLVNRNDAPVQPSAARQETTAAAPQQTPGEPTAATTLPGTTSANAVLQSTQAPSSVTVPAPRIGIDPVNSLGSILPATIGGGASPAGEPKATTGEPKGSEGNSQTGKPTTTERTLITGTDNPVSTDVVTEPAPAAEANEAKITKEVPNFFSPNNDGENDFFFIESQNLNSFSVNFYDTKGNTIWKSEDASFKWDGTSMSGEPVPAGLYGCMILARDAKGKLIKVYKNIEIRR